MRGFQSSYVPVVLLIAASLCQGGFVACFADESTTKNYLYPAKDVDPAALRSDDRVVVTKDEKAWSFTPSQGATSTALLFFPGGGVEPIAYAPLARALAQEGWSVHVVNLSGRLAAPDEHRRNAIAQGKAVIASLPGVKRWVVGGHSMGGAIAAQFVSQEPSRFRGLVLIGTTHPRDFDLSGFEGAVTKSHGTEDRVAKLAQSEANKRLLPAGTKWVRVEGGNHAQFGYYGPQLGDGSATIRREEQQQATGAAVAEVLRHVSEAPE